VLGRIAVLIVNAEFTHALRERSGGIGVRAAFREAAAAVSILGRSGSAARMILRRSVGPDDLAIAVVIEGTRPTRVLPGVVLFRAEQGARACTFPLVGVAQPLTER